MFDVTVAIAVMARYPEGAAVKTRLSACLSEAERALLYQAFLRDKLQQLRGLPRAQLFIAYSPVEERSWFAALAGPELTLLAQHTGSLGERVVAAFSALHRDCECAILLDSDTPHLPREYIVQAIEALEAGEQLVIGPADDGGYYLIGLARCPLDFLRDVPWSTPDTRAQTIAAAARLGMRAHLLPSWYDVDRPDDLDRLRRDLARDGGAQAPHTWAALNTLARGE
jgi:rSAM/selenodomain-associated transferase 1